MMGGSGISWIICKSFAPQTTQITTPVPYHSFFYGPDALPDAKPTVSEPNVNRFLADRTIGCAFGTMCHLSSVCLSPVVVCDILYCGKTVRPSEKLSEEVNRKAGSKVDFFGSPPYFYFRFRRYGLRDGRFLPYVLWRNGTS